MWFINYSWYSRKVFFLCDDGSWNDLWKIIKNRSFIKRKWAIWEKSYIEKTKIIIKKKKDTRIKAKTIRIKNEKIRIIVRKEKRNSKKSRISFEKIFKRARRIKIEISLR